MSDAENERQKQRIRSFLHNGRRIEDAYPQIEKIEINYLKEHNSFVGHNEKDGKWTLTPQSEMYFVIDCLNRECTSIGYDLSSVVGSAIRNHETEVSGTMRPELEKSYYPQPDWILDAVHTLVLPLEGYAPGMDFRDEELMRQDRFGI